jgi:hypothetical protein
LACTGEQTSASDRQAGMPGTRPSGALLRHERGQTQLLCSFQFSSNDNGAAVYFRLRWISKIVMSPIFDVESHG